MSKTIALCLLICIACSWSDARASVYEKFKGKALMADCTTPPATYPVSKKLHLVAWFERWCIGGEAGQYSCGIYDTPVTDLLLRTTSDSKAVQGYFSALNKKCTVDKGERGLVTFSGSLMSGTEYDVYNTKSSKVLFTFKAGAGSSGADGGVTGSGAEDDGCAVAGGQGGGAAGLLLLAGLLLGIRQRWGRAR